MFYQNILGHCFDPGASFADMQEAVFFFLCASPSPLCRQSIRTELSNVSTADLKLHLQSTDYGSFLANEASPLTVSVIDDKLKEKMVVEFRHMRNQSYEPLASFMDFIT